MRSKIQNLQNMSKDDLTWLYISFCNPLLIHILSGPEIAHVLSKSTKFKFDSHQPQTCGCRNANHHYSNNPFLALKPLFWEDESQWSACFMKLWKYFECLELFVKVLHFCLIWILFFLGPTQKTSKDIQNQKWDSFFFGHGTEGFCRISLESL